MQIIDLRLPACYNVAELYTGLAYPVNLPRYPLRINVGFLLNQPVGTRRDIHFAFPDLRLSPDLEVTDFSGVVQITRMVQGMFVEFSCTANTGLECVRFLAPYNQALATSFQEVYAFRRDQVTESGLLVPEDGNIDLAPLVNEYMQLEIPIKPLCRPDCKGLCVECGADLNTETCEHQKSIRVSP